MHPLVLLSSLAAGGAERVTVALAEELARTGRATPLATLTARQDGPPADEVRRLGLERVDLGVERLADARAALRLHRLLDERGIDVLHAHGQDASIVAAATVALRRWMGRGGPRLVVTRHVLAEPRESARESLRASLALRALRSADRAVAVSDAVALRLRRAGCDPDRLVTIPNGVDVDAFARGDVEDARLRDATRHALRLGAGVPVALVLAVLRPGKGHRLLLEAFEDARRDLPDAALLVAGDGPMRDEIEAQARALRSPARFLGARADVPALIAACDVVVLASEAEALPTALIEAAAGGRPVVATDVGGTREVVADGVTGSLVPPGDRAALAAAIVRVLGDDDHARSLGSAGRRVAAERFTIARQADATWSLWGELTERGS